MKKNQWFTILKEKKPGLLIVLAIALFNVLFLALFSLIVALMSELPYFTAVFHCLAMMLDPGCISDVVDGKGQAVLCIICFIVVIVGLIAFTGSVIGYVSNIIADFIEKANNGKNKLELDDHAIILNWNDRGLEIINEYLLLEEKAVIVVLSDVAREIIEQQVNDTVFSTVREKGVKNKLSIIIRTGSVFSSQQLLDISIESAKTVIVLEESGDDDPLTEDGNGHTIKTLMQVADILSKKQNDKNQKVVVEVTDDWTEGVINEIVECKNNDKVRIVAVPVNQLFGNIFTQFAVMPKLNAIYTDLFSNEGVEFHSFETEYESEKDFVLSYLETHAHTVPLTVRKFLNKNYAICISINEKSLERVTNVAPTLYPIRLSDSCKLKKRHIVILGHNKNLPKILDGLNNFNNEWKGTEDALSVLLLDDASKESKSIDLSKYTFIEDYVQTDIHQKDEISKLISQHLDNENTTVLILSAENAEEGEKDLPALANLIYLQSALNKKKLATDNNIDIVVEIIEPKHHDIVQNYSKSNVVISNRYVSKIIMQIADKEALFDFYKDILTFDTNGEEGKEIYIKNCSTYFEEIPTKMNARDFIYSLYSATLAKFGEGEVAIGVVDENQNINLFSDNLDEQIVSLNENSKLIILSNH